MRFDWRIGPGSVYRGSFDPLSRALKQILVFIVPISSLRSLQLHSRKQKKGFDLMKLER